jgi:alanine-synthesizing transaminase
VLSGLSRIASKWIGVGPSPNEAFKGRIGYNAILQELNTKGKRVIELYGANVADWGHINKTFTEFEIEAAKEKWGCTYASATNAMVQLRESIASFEKHMRRVDCSPQDIIPYPGIAGAWNTVHNALLDPGDEVVCPAPAHYFWGPASYMSFFGARAVSSGCDEKNDWQPNLEDLRGRINDKTKAIVLDHPTNPTGAIYSEKVLKGIVNLAGEFDLCILADEIYDLVLYDGLDSALSVASLARDVPVITMYSTSKFLMKPGWRLGYVNFHDPNGKMEEMRRVVNLLSETYGYGSRNLATLIMGAGIKAFKGPFDESKEMLKKLQQSREYTFKRLNEISGVSCNKAKATLYSFPRIDAIGKVWKTDEEFVLSLLREEAVFFVPGSFFGDAGFGHFRTLLMPEVRILEEAYNRLERFLAKHV